VKKDEQLLDMYDYSASDNSMDDIFDEIELLSLLSEIQTQENEMNDAVNREQNTNVSSNNKSKDDDQNWMNSLMDDLKNRPDASKEVFVPKTIEDFPRDIYSDAQLSEIKKGIDHRLNVDIYSDVKYSGRQMREIRFGLERNLDISHYANVFFRERQMKQIRLGLQQGLDVSSYARILFSATDMKEKRQELFITEKLPYADEISYDFEDKDTGMHIFIKKGLMEAGVILRRKLPNEFSKKDLCKLLATYGIIYGFAEEELPSNLGNLPLNTQITVAYGKKPIEGTDGYYKLIDTEYDNKKPSIREDGSVDYIVPVDYKKIKVGDVVAELVPSTKGENGINVMGINIGSILGKDAEPIDSKDLLLSRDKTMYLSKKQGFIVVKDRSIEILDFLTFDRTVNYMDGKITFDGNIRINGNVESNVEIVCSGDIYITGYVEGARIKAGNDVIISGGVNGSDNCKIIAGHNVTSAFFESAKIEADGDIETGYILNCDVECHGELKTKGKKSLICGGSIIAYKGIDVGTVGSRNRVKTYIEVGNKDDRADEYRDLIKQRDKVDKDVVKTNMVMEQLILKMGALLARQNESYIKLQNVLSSLNDHKKSILDAIKVIEDERIANAKIHIQVSRDVYENTTVCVNGNRLVISEDMRSSTFRSEGRKVEVS